MLVTPAIGSAWRTRRRTDRRSQASWDSRRIAISACTCRGIGMDSRRGAAASSETGSPPTVGPSAALAIGARRAFGADPSLDPLQDDISHLGERFPPRADWLE